MADVKKKNKGRKHRFRLIVMGILLSLLFGSIPLVQDSNASPVQIVLIAEDSTFKPGTPFWVAIDMKMKKNWHVYWKNPGDAGMAPAITWSLPEGFHAGDPLWPMPSRFTLEDAVGFGYEDELVLLVEITPPTTYDGALAELGANIRFVACSDNNCLPGQSPLSLKLASSAKAPEKSVESASLFSTLRERLPKKHEALNARRNQALIELSFQEISGAGPVKNAEFFPENEGVMNYAEAPIFESLSEGKYTLIFEEMEPQKTLDGILVVHTDEGKLAYQVNIPLPDPDATIAVRDQEDDFDSNLNGGTLNRQPYEFQGGVGLAIALAFIGGMILNLMPCVLPVISFKILSFISLAGKQRKLILQHGLAFSFGVLLSFWVLAATLLGLQAYGRSVGWGFQLQEPLFVGILAALIFVFGLSLFGVFEIGTSVMAKAGEIQHNSSKKNALIGSFMSGILATAVATPCTGPFLGTTVGFAVTLPPLQAMLTFTSLGLGMSFPYLVLAVFPSLLKFLPKPGNWMITFKELMGFLMMASVIWLISVFSVETDAFATTVFLGGLFFLSIACWIYGRWASAISSKTSRAIGTCFAALFLTVGCYAIFTSASERTQAISGTEVVAWNSAGPETADVWEEFSPERVNELRAEGTPVFIDFTAKWCLICQANHVVLSSSEVAEKFAKLGVVRMKADWTKANDVITKELKKFGRNSVPLYVFYHGEKDAEPHILPQLLTPEIVLEMLDKIQAVL